ncbi:MAG: cholesterol catabolism transcriptional regulator KstR [Rhodococcus sp. (in: high G+C Gram-positive bacteria)]
MGTLGSIRNGEDPVTRSANERTTNDAEIGTRSQRERRTRILDATLALASKGGYDAVQMRDVADKAEVAVGTLYRYFPSKVHLLVTALGREMERFDGSGARTKYKSLPAEQRLHVMIGGITRAMQKDPLLTEAMTRAFMFADASVGEEVDHVGRLMDGVFAAAMTDGEPSATQLDMARVISDVWLSNLVAWVTRRATAQDVARRMDTTVALLLQENSIDH